MKRPAAPTPTAGRAPAPTAESPGTSSAPILLRASDGTLIVPPFRLVLHGQAFVHASTLRIDLRSLVPGTYRVLAVQNFWIEDENPDLDECIAGVFLARRRSDGRWEEPERWPLECRTLAVLGHVTAGRDPRRSTGSAP